MDPPGLPAGQGGRHLLWSPSKYTINKRTDFDFSFITRHYMENTYKEWATEVLFLQSFTYGVNNSCIDNLKKSHIIYM